MFVQFGQLIGDDTTVKVNLIGLILSVIYVFVFNFYTPADQKLSVWGKVGAAGAFTAAIIAYTMVREIREF